MHEEVDARPQHGRFVLTGSQHFGFLASVTQSLAGRTAVVHLLPPSISELRKFPQNPLDDLFKTIWMGAYPRIHDQQLPPDRWLADYVATYVQRDVRQVLAINDLSTFTTFLKLCAGRTGQEINLSSLGNDAGISHNTARSWLGLLETSFICFRLPAWHRNINKQLIKAPKLHFFDSGLVCFLLGITSPEQLRHHPLRGAIFETWVCAEIFKSILHRGQSPALFHFRDAKGLEIDLVREKAGEFSLIEIKSAATISPSFFGPLEKAAAVLSAPPISAKVKKFLVYGGEEKQRRTDFAILPWMMLDRLE